MWKFNPFTPEFQRWTLPSFYLDTATDENSLKSKIIWETVDPDDPSRLDLHCLHKCLALIFRAESIEGRFWSSTYSKTCVREPPSRLTLNSG